MVKKKHMTQDGLTGEQIILLVGTEIYGDNFNLDDPLRKENYQRAYERLMTSLRNKKSKGLLVIGSIGVGKSNMMKVMQRVVKDTDRKFGWVTASQLKDLSEELTASRIKEMYGKDFQYDLLIDDIGISIDVRRYGNTINILSEIIMERYELFIETGIKTHFTSNIYPDLINNTTNKPTLKTIYGTRVLDRMKEMCEMIIWKGTSLRK
jgi:DNA replication protein DnaC